MGRSKKRKSRSDNGDSRRNKSKINNDNGWLASKPATSGRKKQKPTVAKGKSTYKNIRNSQQISVYGPPRSCKGWQAEAFESKPIGSSKSKKNKIKISKKASQKASAKNKNNNDTAATKNKGRKSNASVRKFQMKLPSLHQTKTEAPWWNATQQKQSVTSSSSSTSSTSLSSPPSDTSKKRKMKNNIKNRRTQQVQTILNTFEVNSTMMKQLNDELSAFAEYVKLTPEERLAREYLIDKVRTLAKQSFWIEPSQCQIFGSFAAPPVCLFESDIDMALWGVVESSAPAPAPLPASAPTKTPSDKKDNSTFAKKKTKTPTKKYQGDGNGKSDEDEEADDDGDEDEREDQGQQVTPSLTTKGNGKQAVESSSGSTSKEDKVAKKMRWKRAMDQYEAELLKKKSIEEEKTEREDISPSNDNIKGIGSGSLENDDEEKKEEDISRKQLNEGGIDKKSIIDEKKEEDDDAFFEPFFVIDREGDSEPVIGATTTTTTTTIKTFSSESTVDEKLQDGKEVGGMKTNKPYIRSSSATNQLKDEKEDQQRQSGQNDKENASEGLPASSDIIDIADDDDDDDDDDDKEVEKEGKENNKDKENDNKNDTQQQNPTVIVIDDDDDDDQHPPVIEIDDDDDDDDENDDEEDNDDDDANDDVGFGAAESDDDTADKLEGLNTTATTVTAGGTGGGRDRTYSCDSEVLFNLPDADDDIQFSVHTTSNTTPVVGGRTNTDDDDDDDKVEGEEEEDYGNEEEVDEDENEDVTVWNKRRRKRTRSVVSLSSSTSGSDDEDFASGIEVSFVESSTTDNDTAEQQQQQQQQTVGPKGETRVAVIRALNALARKLRKTTNIVHQLTVRKGARVPIINMVTRFGYECDIALGGHNGMDTTHYTWTQISKYKSFATVVLLLKIILFQNDLDKPFTGGLGSYKLYVLVASHIQRHLSLGGSDCPAEILFMFLYRYGQIYENGFTNCKNTTTSSCSIPVAATTSLEDIAILQCEYGGKADLGGCYQLENCIKIFGHCWQRLWSKLKVTPSTTTTTTFSGDDDDFTTSTSTTTTGSILRYLVDAEKLSLRRYTSKGSASKIFNMKLPYHLATSEIAGQIIEEREKEIQQQQQQQQRRREYETHRGCSATGSSRSSSSSGHRKNTTSTSSSSSSSSKEDRSASTTSPSSSKKKKKMITSTKKRKKSNSNFNNDNNNNNNDDKKKKKKKKMKK